MQLVWVCDQKLPSATHSNWHFHSRRCLTIVRAMNIDTTDDNGGYTAGSVEHAEASGGALTQITSNHDAGRQEPRPGRNRAQLG